MTERLTMRPVFTIPLQGDGTAVLQKVHERLGREQAPFVGQVLKRHAFLQLPRHERSLLSPYLNLQLRDRDDGSVCLDGRFTPHPAVWTGFMAIYGVLAMVGLAGLVLGWAQTTVDEYPWGFWAAPVCLVLIAFVYGASVIGQGLTADEMHAQRRFVERSLHEAGEVVPGCDF
ncbi:hypothetical protein DRQ50_01165 [bacterium]|nr:MAG: hypothetical protein DRQ50_01165 [bacterium]